MKTELSEEDFDALIKARDALREKAFEQGSFKLEKCTSTIQRKLQCGYNRAADIMTWMEERKMITEPDSQGARVLAAFNPN